MDVSQLSLDEIRARFGKDRAPLTIRTLNRMRRDERLGVRKLYESLKRRYDREECERRRLDAMLHMERVLWKSGVLRIAGVDEVGMGPLAGPVIAATVVFAPGTELPGIDDSKKLEPEDREAADALIRKHATGIGIGTTSVEEIDRVNVYHAGLLAMRRALDALPEPPQHVLVDARTIPDLAIPQNVFTKGDGIDFSIAAASIVAKVHRDRLMNELDAAHPGYGFARHKGYGTAEHQDAIRRLGPCPIHRRSFIYLRELRGECTAAFYGLKERLFALEGTSGLDALTAEIDARIDELGEPEHRKLRVLVSRRWNGVGR